MTTRAEIHWHTLDQFALQRHLESLDDDIVEAAENERDRRATAGGSSPYLLSNSEESEP